MSGLKRQNGESGYHRAIAREIGGGAHVVDVRGGSVLMLTCTGGRSGEPHSTEYPMGVHLPPERINKHMAGKGWRIGKRLTCPACMEKERNMATASPAPQPEPKTPAASDAAKRATRMIFMALEDYYDEGTKAFKPGHSDKSIADELGVSEVYVAKVRDDHFGPLAEPTEFAEIRKRLDGYNAGIATVNETYNRAVEDLRRQGEAIRFDLDRMAKANGWRS